MYFCDVLFYIFFTVDFEGHRGECLVVVVVKEPHVLVLVERDRVGAEDVNDAVVVNVPEEHAHNSFVGGLDLGHSGVVVNHIQKHNRVDDNLCVRKGVLFFAHLIQVLSFLLLLLSLSLSFLSLSLSYLFVCLLCVCLV